MLTCPLHIHDVMVKVRKFLFNYNIREFNYGFPFQLCLKIPDNKIWEKHWNQTQLLWSVWALISSTLETRGGVERHPLTVTRKV